MVQRQGSGTSPGGDGLQAAVVHLLELRRWLELLAVSCGELGQQAEHLAATCMVSGEEWRRYLAWIPPVF